MKNLLYVLLAIWLVFACSKNEKRLPIFGTATIGGNKTVNSAIKQFSFINQDGLTITKKTFENKIYVTDLRFFFCPAFCPKMIKELKDTYNLNQTNSHSYFFSHTIDPEHDEIPSLKKYTEKLGIDNSKWFFVTGNMDSIYSIADKSCLAAAFTDESASGDYFLYDNFLYIDLDKKIRVF